MKYLALLRGINVGGNNLIKMASLKTCLESAGFRRVATYIQSGNVLFESAKRNAGALGKQIEQVIARNFGKTPAVLVLSQPQMLEVVSSAPEGFGTETELFHYDVAFLLPPARADELLPSIQLKEGVDCAWEGKAALYFRRLKSRAGESRLSKLTTHPAYRSMTIRNWATTTKILDLMG